LTAYRQFLDAHPEEWRVLCRNLAFSYFDDAVQRAVASSLRAVMRTGGVLVVGREECVPDGVAGFTRSSPWLYIAT
nr:hypothetical protein [Deltaproteobacteria bacterium]